MPAAMVANFAARGILSVSASRGIEVDGLIREAGVDENRRTSLFVALALAMIWASGADAQGKGKTGLKITGAEFDPERVCDAEAAWVRNIGLTADDDRFAYGFLMHKLCSTATNAAAFGLIAGAQGQTLIGAQALGFDFKNFNGGFAAHCTGGAPRFNVSMSDGTFHFVGGCGNGTQSLSPAGTGWTRVRFDPQNPAQAFPPVPTNATIVSIHSSSTKARQRPEWVAGNRAGQYRINGKFVTRP